MYYTYWLYTRQGVVPVFFPVPFLGTNLKWMKETPKTTDFSKSLWLAMYQKLFGDKVPPVTLEMRIPQGVVFFNDPEYVNEIYVTKNKYFDKSSRLRAILDNSFGESILFERSTELQATKRKHISAAFYKEKMVQMMKQITLLTAERVKIWKEKFLKKE